MTYFEPGRPPFAGMKTVPYGLPLTSQAWIDCCMWAIGQDDFVNAFKAETGYDMQRIGSAAPIVKVIDKATGYDKTVFAAFCDWVTVNIWGEEDADESSLP